MKKNNFSAIIDLGHSKLRFGIFDDNFINLYSSSKKIMENDTEENYSKNINSLIIESEKKISNHIDDIIVMYDLDEIFSIDISIKRNFDKKVNIEANIWNVPELPVQLKNLRKNCVNIPKVGEI